jgi:hypothetical protein
MKLGCATDMGCMGGPGAADAGCRGGRGIDTGAWGAASGVDHGEASGIGGGHEDDDVALVVGV